jgi:class 3 adenylate cyclase
MFLIVLMIGIQFTVIGTHVNLASRLEGRAEKREIIISTFTMAKVRGKSMLKLLIYLIMMITK